MRTQGNKVRGRLRLILCGLWLLTSCSRVGFTPAPPAMDFLQQPPIQWEDDSRPPMSPPTPTPPPPPVLPAPVEKTGFCENAQNISGCLSCETPAPPPPPPAPPTLSVKAQELARILSLSCPVPNKSDPAFYSNYPTEKELQKRLESCGDLDYPETPTTPLQRETFQRLLAEDSGFRQNFFGGRWYKPPYSDHFELYFGIESDEARKIFCYRQQPAQEQMPGDLLTTEFWRDCRQSLDDCWNWRRDAQAQKRWRDVQKIRQGLKVCLDRPLPPVTTPPPNLSPPRLCQWKSFEGPRALVEANLAVWQKDFIRISVEDSQSCSKTGVPPGDSRWLKITGYFCP